MDASMKQSVYILFLALLFVFSVNNNAKAQSNKPFLEFDSLTYENTIQRVYEIWGNSEYSKEQEVDTILCAFFLQFDTLNLSRIQLDEDLLKKSISFSFDDNNSYECDCTVYNMDFEIVATFGSFNDYHVFHKAKYNRWGPEYLKERILDNGDMVFIPQSKVHTFNFNWRVIITKNDELRWFHLEHPHQTYKSSEIYSEHWSQFLLGK